MIKGGGVGGQTMFKPFFVCNFCIILNDFSRNPLETFHEGSESVRVNDLLRLNLKLKIADKKMQNKCLKKEVGGGWGLTTV